uniref:ORF26 n=1 Tax=Nitrosopumilaceae spindle-shaped virus TaxID=3065433 RepID=A0AAT9JA82_9VIRU
MISNFIIGIGLCIIGFSGVIFGYYEHLKEILKTMKEERDRFEK